MLAALLICEFACVCLEMNVSAFLPSFVEATYPSLSALAVGCLMIIFPVGAIATGPFIGSYLETLGRKNAVIIGVVLITLATLCFGFASYFRNAGAFYAASMLARLLQGVGDVFVNIAIPSILILEFPDKKVIYLGYCSFCAGAGLFLGPVIGSVVYSLLDYTKTFYFFAVFIGSIGGTCIYFIPSRVNQKQNSQNINNLSELSGPKMKISYR